MGFLFLGPQPWPRALVPICFWWPRPRFVHIGASPQFVFTSPGPQSVFVRPNPSICIYQTWLIRIGNNKSQRFHVMLLFLFLLSGSFVTVIGCCSLSFLLDICVSRPLALALTPIFNQYLLVPGLNLYLLGPVLNLCLPVFYNQSLLQLQCLLI